MPYKIIWFLPENKEMINECILLYLFRNSFIKRLCSIKPCVSNLTYSIITVYSLTLFICIVDNYLLVFYINVPYIWYHRIKDCQSNLNWISIISFIALLILFHSRRSNAKFNFKHLNKPFDEVAERKQKTKIS